MSRRSTRAAQRATQARKRRIAYGAIVAGAALILILIAVAIRSGQPSVDELATNDVIALGQQVYEQNCASCHGPEGNGHAAVPEAPALNDREHAWHHPDGQLQQVVTNGGQQMPAFGEQLSDEEIIAAIRYIQTWWQPGQLAQQQAQSEGFPFQ